MNEQPPKSSLLPDVADWERIAAGADEAQLRDAFIGVYRDREALGQELLAEAQAIERARWRIAPVGSGGPGCW